MEISFESIFETNNADVSIYSLDKVLLIESYLIDEYVSSSKVIWELQPDMRNDRIKSMGLVIKRVIATINWQNTDEDNPNEGIIEFDSASKDYKDWEIVNDVEFFSDGGVSIDTVDIDFSSKKITVS